MKLARLLLLFLFLLLISSFQVSAFQEIECSIFMSGTTNINVYVRSNEGSFTYPLPKDAVFALGHNGILSEDGLSITFIGEEYGLIDTDFSYSTSSYTSKDGLEWSLMLPDELFQDSENNLVIKFPSNSKILNHSTTVETYTFADRLHISKSNVDKDFVVNYVPGESIRGVNYWVIGFVLILVIVILVFISFWYGAMAEARKESKKQAFKSQNIRAIKVDSSKTNSNIDSSNKSQDNNEISLSDSLKKQKHLFTENEYKVLEIMVDDNKITQKNLQAKSFLPKSTLSRTLTKLENKEMVETIRVGMGKHIQIKKDKFQ